MTGTALLLALVLSGATEELTPTRLEGLNLKVPSSWKLEASDKSTLHYDSPKKDASFELSVFPVDPRRKDKVCVDELVKALGPSGWSRTSVGGAAAARKIATERLGEGKEKDPVDVHTTSYVGCNGATKWVLTFTSSTDKRQRYDALTKEIVGSIAYAN